MNDLLKGVGEPVAWMYVNTDGECEQIEYGKDSPCDGFEPLYTSAQLQAAYAKGQEVMRERAANIAMTEANLQRDLDKVRNTTMAVVYSQDAMKWKKIAAAIRALPIEGEQNAVR